MQPETGSLRRHGKKVGSDCSLARLRSLKGHAAVFTYKRWFPTREELYSAPSSVAPMELCQVKKMAQTFLAFESY